MLPDMYPSVPGLTMATENTKNIYTQNKYALTWLQHYLIFYLCVHSL